MHFTRGVVRAINPCRGMVAIWVEDRGGHTIVEMLSSHDIDVDDQISWSTDTSMGSNPYRNENKGWVSDVKVHKHDVSSADVRAELLMS